MWSVLYLGDCSIEWKHERRQHEFDNCSSWVREEVIFFIYFVWAGQHEPPLSLELDWATGHGWTVLFSLKINQLTKCIGRTGVLAGLEFFIHAGIIRIAQKEIRKCSLNNIVVFNPENGKH